MHDGRSRPGIFRNLIVAVLTVSGGFMASGHPMPHSVLSLDFRKDFIRAELEIPLKEFDIAFPDLHLLDTPSTLIQRKGTWLDSYLLRHFSLESGTHKRWQVLIESRTVRESEQVLTGKFNELVYYLKLQPPAGVSPRHFNLHYDAVMHQLITHKLFINIQSDWYGGLTEKDSLDADLGVLSVSPATGTVQPVVINLDDGSTWKGFSTMLWLGVSHIREGADHLLFLFLLLVPAGLVIRNGKWSPEAHGKIPFKRVVRLVTGFTIGHCLALIAGSCHWLAIDAAFVEISVAATILLTAVNVVTPIFRRKEILLVMLFGLIHGLAFSEVLQEMNVDGSRLGYSILGFNIGIELMQLFIIAITLPWLLLIASLRIYSIFRWIAALFGFVAGIGWIISASRLEPNVITIQTEGILLSGKWLLLGLMVFAIGTFLVFRQRQKA